ATSFAFSHAFQGSVGMVFTLPNEKVLFDASEIDSAISCVFEMAKLTTAESVRQYTERFGIAVVHELYNWCRIHSESDIGADIDWKRGPQVRAALFVQPQELSVLQRAIEESGEEQTERFELYGMLVGVDVQTKSFHFRTDDAEDIHGRFFDAISES